VYVPSKTEQHLGNIIMRMNMAQAVVSKLRTRQQVTHTQVTQAIGGFASAVGSSYASIPATSKNILMILKNAYPLFSRTTRTRLYNSVCCRALTCAG
jgi:type IV secretory pathway VirB6-like protein